MPNSDNTYGTFNKQTTIHSQTDDGSAALTVFASADEAKSHIYTTEALAVWDECCTNIQWALLADDNGDNTKLKVTFDFGTKGTSGITESDDWAGQYNSRMIALRDANNWFKSGLPTVVVCSQSEDHLF